MIRVTITFRASKDTLKKQFLMGAPMRVYDHKDYYVPIKAVGDLIELCKREGWEIKADAVFPSSLDQIYNEVLDNSWKEEVA